MNLIVEYKEYIMLKSRKLTTLNLCVLLMLGVSIGGCSAPESSVEEFRADFISNLGNDPIFSWKFSGNQEGFTQTGYQIIVSDDRAKLNDNPGNIWDSGKQKGSSSLQVTYQGSELQTGTAYYAKVRSWSGQDVPSEWSEALRFVVPLDYPGEWKADWLTYDYEPESALPLFRKPFKVGITSDIESARLYIAAPGYYEAYLNGERVGENVLDPGQTNYEDYTFYTAYEIDPKDLSGENVLAVTLGNGWYNQNVVWGPEMIYGQPVFICQLVIHKKDGSKEIIASDESWMWTSGPITYSNVYGGEHYDARLEVENWNRPGEVSEEWKVAVLPEVHPTQLYEQFAEPIQIMDEVDVKEIIDRGDGTYIFDFGQNMAGWMKLKIVGERGEEITVRCTEELDGQGNIDPRTTGVAATRVIQTQKYICKGEGEEEWEPRFTYFGFRFAEVSGLKQPPAKDFLTGMVLYSSVPDVGSFQCSEENINRLHELSRWTIIGNIHSIPTDCPHREKCGWTGDAHAMIQAMIYNYDSQRFFSKYMFDMRSSGREEKEELYFGESFYDRSITIKPAGIPTMIVPGKRTSGIATPDWGTAIVQIPWYLYLYYGDRVLLEDFYPDMKTWVEYIHAKCEDGIVTHGLGDWCPPGGNVNIDCPVPVSSTAYHILDVGIMKQVSALLGNTEDYTSYSAMLEQLKRDFNRHFFDRMDFTYGSQTANAMALDIGIVPEDYREKVAGSIVRNMNEEFDGFINTGIFGLARIFKVLSENGYEEEVFRLLTKTGENSFAFMWDHYDATTLWEILPCSDTYDEGVYVDPSHSHPMQAGFDAWFYSGIAGINPVAAEPGFQQIEFKPYLTKYLGSASGSYISKSGTITSKWERIDGKLTWNISIPANTKGVVHVPTYRSEASIQLNGNLWDVLEEKDGFSLIGEFGPGEYLVEVF